MYYEVTIFYCYKRINSQIIARILQFFFHAMLIYTVHIMLSNEFAIIIKRTENALLATRGDYVMREKHKVKLLFSGIWDASVYIYLREARTARAQPLRKRPRRTARQGYGRNLLNTRMTGAYSFNLRLTCSLFPFKQVNEMMFDALRHRKNERL